MNHHFWSRITLAFVFFYHGLVPKILFLSPVEVSMIDAHGINLPAEVVATVGGGMEIGLALLILWFRYSRWPLIIALAALVMLLLDVMIFSPGLLIEAFNPLTTNITAIVLCLIGLSGDPHQSRQKQ
ncbi:DoxX-like family protein [Hahella ganghwensis]|uniref:DoxX-like family protein n=1 Tax=Hahella ganghwensis TaxID=286420 RepID=UPI00036B0A35|nr:DoxX-like family protein [Hahella ganghwensis]